MSEGDAPGPLERASLPALSVGELLVEQMAEAVITVGLDHKVQSWSRGAERVYGFAAEEAIGKAIFSLIRPEMEVADFQRFVDELTAEGRLSETARRVRKDGRAIEVETTFVLLRDEAGAPSGILGVARDITGAQKERARELDEARLRGLEQRVNEAELVVALDGQILAVNDRAAALYGWSRAELAERIIADLRAPGTLPSVDTQLQRAAAEGVRFETEHRRRDGTIFPVEVSSRSFVVGGQRYLHTLVRDLSEQRRQDERLRLLAGITTRMSDAVIVTDAVLRIVEATGNAPAIYGFTREELVGKRLLHDFAIAFPEGDEAEVRRKLEAGEELRTRMRARRKDGVWIDADTLASPQHDARGRVTGWLSVARDVSERAAASRALRESEARTRSLAEGVVSHDVDGRIVDCNEAAEQILGLRRAQLEGRDSMDPSWRTVHEDGSPFPGEEHPAMVTLRTGEPQRHVIMGVHQPDGALRWISISSVPLRLSPELAPQGVVTTFTDVTALKRAIVEQERLVGELREALHQVKTLSGLLPICMFCKKIRDDHGEWKRVEQYLSARTDATFSHGLCPTCEEQHYPEVPPGEDRG
jgi:PAS domain S-box-containing protein